MKLVSAARKFGLFTRTTIVASCSLAIVFSGDAFASGSLGNVGVWQSSSLPVTQMMQTATTSYGNYAYVIGGVNGGSFTSTIYYAALNSNGSVGTWTTASNSLPVALNNESAVAYNGYLYVIGGDANSGLLNSVYYAPINSNGSVGTWQTSTNVLPNTVANGAAVEENGYLYLFGGDASGNLNSVYYAPINSNGSVGTWQTSTNVLPSATTYASAAVFNGYVYVVGGTTSGVFYAPINSNGSVGTWTTATNAPSFDSYQLAAISNGYLIVYGGISHGAVQSAALNANGSVGTWTTSPNSLDQLELNAGFEANGYLYSIGGFDLHTSSSNTVFYAPLNYTNQATVNNSATNTSVLINVPQGDNISCNSASSEASQAHQDSGYTYPLGLTTFCFTTENAANNVSLTFVTNLTPSQVVARDYNPTTGQYTTIPNASITETTYNGSPALVLSYTITDGGVLDNDGLANQSITDPVGLAVPVVSSAASVVASAPDTGFGKPVNYVPMLLLLIGSVSTAGLGFALNSRSKRN